MFHLNKRLLLFSVLFLFLLFPRNVNALVSPTKEFYVNDYANILSEDTEKYIVKKSSELEKVDGTQIVVVTVKSLDDYSLEDYAYQLFKEFKIGDEKKDNGLLLLLSLKERKFRVEVGNGLEGILPDGKTGRYQDEYIIPYLKDNKWDEGIKNGYNAFYSEIVRLNHLDLDAVKPTGTENNYEISNFEVFLIIASFLSGVILYFVFNAINYRHTVIYLLAVFLLSFLVPFFFLHLIGFLMSLIFSNGDFYIGSSGGFGGSSGGGFSGGGFSGGGFSGGGGSSSGGGSSRGF